MSKKIRAASEAATRSSRLSVVKTLWINRPSIFFLPDPCKSCNKTQCEHQDYTYSRNLANSFLWQELWKAGYRIPDEMVEGSSDGEKKASRIKILYSDLQLIIKFSEERSFNNYKLFLRIAPFIEEVKSKTERRNLYKTLLTALKMSEVNDTINVGMSQRARVAFQKEGFGSSFKLTQQNVVLGQLALMGLGTLSTGSSYTSGKLPQLSILTLTYLDEKEYPLDFPILSTLAELGLVEDLLQENPIDSQSCYDQYTLVMSLLDDASKAFKNYCDAKTDEYKTARANWCEENKDEVKPKPVVDNTFKPKKEVKYNPTKLERKWLKEGKGEIVNNKFVLTSTEEPESEVADVSYLLDSFSSPVELTPINLQPARYVSGMWDEIVAKKKEEELANIALDLVF